LIHKPDLIVVCFGLNDANDEVEGLSEYTNNLKELLGKIKASGTEVIFMTPNMMNTYTDCSVTDPVAVKLAQMFARKQKDGYFDSFIDSAREICREEGVPVADCYAIWKQMYECGADTTRLLSNRLNHPTRDMHWLFAWEIVKTILKY
ncbi:MAG: GDSL family lipase, partial [Clostridia bacterium]|nr:GDSL family lipase [Clostridia bacterium]